MTEQERFAVEKFLDTLAQYSGTRRVDPAYTSRMPSDLIFSCRPTPGLAAKVDKFAREIGITRSAAMLLLLSFGVDSNRSAILRHAVGVTVNTRLGDKR